MKSDLKNDFLESIQKSLNCTHDKKWKGHNNVFELFFPHKGIVNIYVLISGTITSFGWGIKLSQIDKLKKEEEDEKKQWFLFLLSHNKRYCLSPADFIDFRNKYHPKNSQGCYKIWRKTAEPYLKKHEDHNFEKLKEKINL